MLIDVIVPIYNGRAHIQKFFVSFLDQGDRDVRFIFVDDGSTDDTPALLMQRVQGWVFPTKLLRQEHRGPGAARNLGLTASDADFVTFFDIDDRPSPDYIVSLKLAARTQVFEIFVFGLARLRPGQRIPPPPLDRARFYRRSSLEQLGVFLSDPARLGAYNLLLSRDFLRRTQMRFSERVPYYEDYDFLYRAFAKAGVIVCTDRALYCYMQQSGSAMAAFGPARFSCLFALRELEDWFEREKPDFAADYKRWGVARIYWSALWQAALAAPSFADFLRVCEHTFAGVYLRRLRRFPDRLVALSSRAFTLSKLAFYAAVRLRGAAHSQVQRAPDGRFGAVLTAPVPDPRRILAYGMTDNPGGIESYLMGLIRRQRPKTFDLLCDFPSIVCEQELRARGAEIHFIPPKGKHPLGHWLALRRLMRDRPDYTTVYLNVLDAGCAFTALIPWLFKRRIVVHSHNGGTDKPRLHRFSRPLLGLMTSGRAACSNEAAAYMFGRKADRALLIPNAIDVRRYRYNPALRVRVRSDLRLGQRPVLCHVGRLSAQKNPFFLLDVFAQVLRMYPPAVLLQIGGGELAGEFDEYVRRRGLAGSVLRLGTRPDVEAFLQAADLFLLPSLYEGLPIALLEAQAAGLPCLVSDAVTRQASVTKLVRRLSVSENPTRWANAALTLLRTPREDVSGQLVRAGFDISRCGESDGRLMRLLVPGERTIKDVLAPAKTSLERILRRR